MAAFASSPTDQGFWLLWQLSTGSSHYRGHHPQHEDKGYLSETADPSAFTFVFSYPFASTNFATNSSLLLIR